jgi:thioredoxin reductase (NADPH)
VRAAPLLEVRNPAVPSDSVIPVVRSDVSIRDLTAAHFKPTTYGNDNVLVYFWAPLCASCDVFTPTYQASSEKHPDIVHGKVNFETER